MRLSMLILLAVVLGLTFGVGITVIELGAAPAGNVDDAFAARPAMIDPNGPKAVFIASEESDSASMERESFRSHWLTTGNAASNPLKLDKGKPTGRCTTSGLPGTTWRPGQP